MNTVPGEAALAVGGATPPAAKRQRTAGGEACGGAPAGGAAATSAQLASAQAQRHDPDRATSPCTLAGTRAAAAGLPAVPQGVVQATATAGSIAAGAGVSAGAADSDTSGGGGSSGRATAARTASDGPARNAAPVASRSPARQETDAGGTACASADAGKVPSSGLTDEAVALIRLLARDPFHRLSEEEMARPRLTLI